ncbi:MAG: alanine--tRNA ligase-related protein [Lachnospiraceae bacterium]
MTEKLFYVDSHMDTFSARVLSCECTENGYDVVLDRTAFFPEGGGQSADTGLLNQVEVVDAKEKEDIVYHQTKSPLKIGEIVQGKIDVAKRFSRMQQHTGEHIVSGIIHRKYGYHNVGFHLGTEAVTMDFDGSITREQLKEIELLANEAVVKDLDIRISYPSKELLERMEYRSKIAIDGQVRIVTIPDYDVCACCAPHMKKTGEIGMIKLIGIQNYKGGVRISMLCGFRALADYNQKEESTKAISVELSAKEEKLVEAVQHQKEEVTRLKWMMANLQSQIFQYKVKEIPSNQEKVSLLEPKLNNDSARELANMVLDQGVKRCIIFFGMEEDSCRYVLASRTEDVRGLGKELNQAFAGRGGGKPEMVQGYLTGKIIEMEKRALE